ncbi:MULTISPECIES: aminotransferase class IV [Halomonadaceae]|uniref:Aminodeoxychorismate lyase n=1 Tax=Vreelandella halophila TaxID=86177 RepID=A0A9X4YCG2_9GAMM|nr:MULTISPECIES: aminotransferase class IV [Halomonas]MYL26926.1 aminodeoxychorismate lyase [Halomonas utahensis]MYL74187.1 aminodeoxychorismate lyase [Halomonas sp. 22501_18_FS]
MPEWIWPGNDPVVPSDDRGLAYGHGVFETLRVTPAGPVLLEAHRERLLAGCHALGIPFDADGLDAWQQQAAERGLLAPQAPAVLKVTVTAGSGGRGYRPPDTVSPRVISALVPAPSVPREGARVRLCQQPLSSMAAGGGYKTLARLEQVLASAELSDGEFEGLMAAGAGSGWVEGTRTCLFSVVDGTLVTPPREQLAVAGTLREWVVRNAGRFGLAVEERALLGADFRNHGLLLGNSVMGLVPVSECGDSIVPTNVEATRLVDDVNRELGLG